MSPGPPDDIDDDEDTLDQPGGTMGRQTMAILISAVQRANEKAVEAVVEQSDSHSRRMGLIVLVILLILAAVVGVTASVTLPDGTTLGASPEK